MIMNILFRVFWCKILWQASYSHINSSSHMDWLSTPLLLMHCQTKDITIDTAMQLLDFPSASDQLSVPGYTIYVLY